MSFIIFQIGQCGNQLGKSFYDFIFQESIASSPEHQAACLDNFFFYKEKAKSLLIDMEPKVVNSCLTSKKNGDWLYDSKSTYCKQEGSGNNWAYGYNHHGPECESPILEEFRVLLEKIDFVQSLLFFQSLAGGTGSGVGSYLLESVKDNYPKYNILNISVMPHLTGEVILQSYNCVLSLSAIYQESDGLILIENDEAQLACTKLLNLKRPSLEDMNEVISKQLSSIFFPTIRTEEKLFPVSQLNGNNSLMNNLEEILSNPLYKLLKIYSIPEMGEKAKEFSNYNWTSLEKRLFQMVISNSSEAMINWGTTVESRSFQKSYGNILIARGLDTSSHQFQLFSNKDIYSLGKCKFKTLVDDHNFDKNERSISLLSNSKNCVSTLDILLERATQMFQEKAYLYQYKKYNLDEKSFHENLLTSEQIFFNYSSL